MTLFINKSKMCNDLTSGEEKALNCNFILIWLSVREYIYANLERADMLYVSASAKRIENNVAKTRSLSCWN